MHSKKEIKSGFIWSAIDSFGTQAVSLVIGLVLANLLGPNVYGLIAMLTIFIAISNVFVNSGFGSALIRKTDRNEYDLATTFYFSIFVSLVCYCLLFVLAPYISEFYDEPDLETLTRFIALTVVFNSFSIIPRTLLAIELKFKLQAKCNIISISCSSIIALILAFNGLGVWALVAQQLTGSIVNTILLNITVAWKPRYPFSKKSFHELFGFGSKLLASGLLDTVYNNLYGLIIGKFFSATQLGLFNQANTLSTMPATTLTGVIQRVTYPMLSTIQHDEDKLDKIYLKTLQFSSAIIFPIMFGLCIISKPFVDLILGYEWKDTATYMSIITMALVLYPIHAINLNMLQVKGRTDLFLKIEVIKKAISSLFLLISVPYGVKTMCIAMVVTSYISLFINTYYTGKLSSLTLTIQLKKLAPIGIITGISSFVGYSIGIDFSQSIVQIVMMLSISLVFYLTLLFSFQNKLMKQIIESIKE